jgi:predicted flap endonuclease-1-like 5' DNA nuclease
VLLQVDAINDLVESDPRFIHLANFFKWELPRSYFVGRLMELGGIGRELANRLFDSGILTPELALATSDQDLRSVRGIGRSTLARLRRSSVRPVIWPPAPPA